MVIGLVFMFLPFAILAVGAPLVFVYAGPKRRYQYLGAVCSLAVFSPGIMILAMALWNNYVEWRAENALRRGNHAVTARAAAIDLSLARRDLERGRSAAGEQRVAQAQDKLDSPKAPKQPPSAVADQLRALEARHGEDLKRARRKRVMSRIDKEGAESRAQP